ncbi:MAG: FkbM family methyltransferase, partial [Pseudomonadota bacterium]
FRHLHFNGPFELQLTEHDSVRLYSWGNRVENELFWRGMRGHEGRERKAWIDMVSGGGDILDVGANTGTYAFIAKAISPSSRVVAFEPLARIAQRIEKNTTTSGLQVQVECQAVAESVSNMTLYDPGGENAYSASLEPDFLPGQQARYSVPVTTIDHYCLQENLHPTAIKIDVEGSEGRVLLGASDTIAKRQVKILCEWLGETDSHTAALAMLKHNGYVAYDVNDHSEIQLDDTPARRNRIVLLVPV